MLHMYTEFIFVGNMHCGYKELCLLRDFSHGYLGLLYPESTVLVVNLVLKRNLS